MWRAFLTGLASAGCLVMFFLACYALSAAPLLTLATVCLLCTIGVAGLFGTGAFGAWTLIIIDDNR